MKDRMAHEMGQRQERVSCSGLPDNDLDSVQHILDGSLGKYRRPLIIYTPWGCYVVIYSRTGVILGGRGPRPLSPVTRSTSAGPKWNFWWVQLDIWDGNLVIRPICWFYVKNCILKHMTDAIFPVTSPLWPSLAPKLVMLEPPLPTTMVADAWLEWTSGISDFVCRWILALKEKRLDLSAQDLVHTWYSTACMKPEVIRWKFKVTRLWSVLPSWVRMSIWLLWFLVVCCFRPHRMHYLLPQWLRFLFQGRLIYSETRRLRLD